MRLLKAVCWVNTVLRLGEWEEVQSKLGPCAGEEGKTFHGVTLGKAEGWKCIVEVNGDGDCQSRQSPSVSYRMASG